MRFRESFRELSPSDIVVNPAHNPRDFSLEENRLHIEGLKVSIKESGLLQPLIVRHEASNDTFVLVAGECRLRAIMELVSEGTPIVKVPVKLTEASDAAELKLIDLTSNTGKPLNKTELGAAYRQLEAWGWEHSAIAKRVGSSERYVREAIELSNAPQEVKAMISEGVITERIALTTVRANGSKSAGILKQKVEVAKSEGKTTLKAARVTKDAEFIKLAREIFFNVADERKENMSRSEDERDVYYGVSTSLLEKLFYLADITKHTA